MYKRQVADQTMAALDELQGRLALSDAALTHDQHALAEHVHQNPVNADHRLSLIHI